MWILEQKRRRQAYGKPSDWTGWHRDPVRNECITFTVRALGPAADSLYSSIGLGRCERIFELPFLPPGLSPISRIGVSRSMRPALRSALVARVLDPGAGEGLENIEVVLSVGQVASMRSR